MCLKKSAILFFIAAFALRAQAQTAEDIIAKYVTFTGGTANWKKVKTIVTSGTYNYNGIGFPFTAFSKAPDLYKYTVPFEGKYFTQAFDGSSGWKIDAFKGETNKTILTGKAALAMMNEADVELESPFINYQQKGHQAIFEGVDSVDGSACFKVKFIRKNGTAETCYFKQNTFELIKKQAPSKNTELENSLLDIYYRDYRTTNGITIPFIQECKTGTQAVLTITIKKITLNEAINDADFKP
jgi:hypothetical protein